MKLYILAVCICTAAFAASSDANFKFRKEKERGLPVGIRVRTAAPDQMQATAFPVLVTVRWRYEHRMDGGPKRKEDLDAILQWESKLDRLLTAKGVGFHFLSRIGRGEVRSLFYVADAQRMRELSAEAGAAPDAKEITYSTSDDPGWSEWKKNS